VLHPFGNDRRTLIVARVRARSRVALFRFSQTPLEDPDLSVNSRRSKRSMNCNIDRQSIALAAERTPCAPHMMEILLSVPMLPTKLLR